jgi:hypothetical protein
MFANVAVLIPIPQASETRDTETDMEINEDIHTLNGMNPKK